MDEKRLAEIETRIANATPGPWGWWDIKDSSAGWGGPDLPYDGRMETNRQWGLSSEDHGMNAEMSVLSFPDGAEGLPNAADATFIAHAREDMPALVMEVRRLRELLKSIQTVSSKR